jgi:manganese-dependent inorganic pyrophosphatase
MITDIIKEGSDILFVGRDKDLIFKAFDVKTDSNIIYLPGVVSRKKQIVPPLSTAAE